MAPQQQKQQSPASANKDALVAAARAGRADDVRSLLLAAARRRDSITDDAAAALEAAAFEGHAHVVDLLLAQTRRGRRLLDAAACSRALLAVAYLCLDGAPAVVQQLLAAGASPAWREGGIQALHVAAQSDGAAAPAVVELLLAAGAPVNERCSYTGRTPLQHAATNSSNQTAAQILRLLLDAGADVRARGADQETALHFAASCGQSREVIELLVGAGSSVADVNDDGLQPIHCATDSLNAETLRALLDVGAAVDAPDNDGRTPLWHAAKRLEMHVHCVGAGGNMPAGLLPGGVAVLVAAGADPAADGVPQQLRWLLTLAVTIGLARVVRELMQVEPAAVAPGAPPRPPLCSSDVLVEALVDANADVQRHLLLRLAQQDPRRLARELAAAGDGGGEEEERGGQLQGLQCSAATLRAVFTALTDGSEQGRQLLELERARELAAERLATQQLIVSAAGAMKRLREAQEGDEEGERGAAAAAAGAAAGGGDNTGASGADAAPAKRQRRWQEKQQESSEDAVAGRNDTKASRQRRRRRR